jgi:hypothetical protein
MAPLAAADKSVADRLRNYTTSQLVDESGERNWQKEQYYREEKNRSARAQRKPFRQWVDETLSGYETSQKPNFIWALVKRLRFPLKDFDEPGGHNMSDVGWKNLTDGQRDRILALAPTFIPTVTVIPTRSTRRARPIGTMSRAFPSCSICYKPARLGPLANLTRSGIRGHRPSSNIRSMLPYGRRGVAASPPTRL